MENREFVLEALKRLAPDTRWHGETLADEGSLGNIDILEEMAYFLLDELFADSVVPPGNRGNGSFEAIAKKKRKVVSDIAAEYFDSDED